ncbi:MAG: hypothetical protein JNK42_06220 [Caedimonas sp.]|nr:hypothetical protein [Caedimonas sp.]
MTLVKTGLTLLVGMTVLSAPTHATNAQLNDLIDVTSLPSKPAQKSTPMGNLNLTIQNINESGVTLGSAIAGIDQDLGGLAVETTATKVASIQNLLHPRAPSIKEGVISINNRLGSEEPDTIGKVKELQSVVKDQNTSLKQSLKAVNKSLGSSGITITDKVTRIKSLSNGSQVALYTDINDKVTRLNTWIAAKITAGTPITFAGPAPAANLEALIAYLQTH